MGGAAAVLGAFRIMAEIQPDVRVLGYVAAAENMPDGSATRPGDVVTHHGGLTSEVAVRKLAEEELKAHRDRLEQLRELDKRRAAILKSLEERDLLTDERSSRSSKRSPLPRKHPVK